MSGLAITSLTLSHFRSYLSAQIAFDGRPVAIFGPNGAGKTNILEAVSLLSPGRGLRRTGEIARKPEGLGWKVTAQMVGLGADHSVETWAEGDAARVVRIDDKAAAQAALGRISRILWLVPAMDRLWIEAAEGRRRFLDRMTLSFFPDHAEAVLGYERAMRERNRLLKDQVSDPHWYGALEGQMAEFGLRMSDHRRAALARISQATGGSVFPVAALELVDEGPRDLREALATGRGRDMAAGRTLAGPHRTDMTAAYVAKGMDAAQCSTGEQKALLISLILANARALAADMGVAPILLLDEVAAHLDPGRRGALYDEICDLGAQALMTGTEESLFDSLGPRGQKLSIAEGAGQSEVRMGE